MRSPQAQGGVRLGVQAGQEDGGLASPRRRPGDSLQASWLCPSPSGRLASPRPLPLPSCPASGTSVLTGSEAPSPSGPTEDCSPDAVAPRALVPSSGSQTSGHLSSEFPPGSGASAPGPHPCPLPSSCPSWHPVPDGHSDRASKGPALTCGPSRPAAPLQGVSIRPAQGGSWQPQARSCSRPRRA